MAGQTGKSGEKKTYYKTSNAIEKGQEWQGIQTKAQVKKKYTGNHSTIEINFNFM
ncbi:MAG: hypothetical protein WDO16_16610 [Bacteroidota bacterium]